MRYILRLFAFLSVLLFIPPSQADAASPAPFGLPGVAGRDGFHRVHKGQTLLTIARHYGLALDHLAMANHLPVQLDAPVGRRLRIPGRRILPAHPPADGLVVNLPERGAYLFRSGRLVAFYPVAIGRAGFETPTGQFHVVSRVKNPAWLPPEWAGKGEIVVPAGPDNPLGDRWIGLSAKGVGLHATTDVPSVGGNVSHGCMRMYPRAAHQLFNLTRVGMPVRIEYETARVGWDDRQRKIVFATFPDIYHRQNPVAALGRLLHRTGLDAFVPVSQVKKMAAREAGETLPLLPAANVWMAGSPPRPASVPAFIVGGRMWLPSDLLKAAGLSVQRSSGGRTIRVQEGSGARRPRQIPAIQTFRVVHAVRAARGLGEPGAVLAAGRAWFPASEIFRDFAGPWRWDPAGHRLQIATARD